MSLFDDFVKDNDHTNIDTNAGTNNYTNDNDESNDSIKPSYEQQQVIESLTNNNVLVDSIAGSGKTTCILFAAKRFRDKEILVLTYNAQLKNETRKRAEGYANVAVHSYHSFCVSAYNKLAYTDDIVNRLIQDNTKPKIDIKYDIIIADEAQDMTPLLCKLFHKIVKDNENQKVCKLMVIGDQMQCIYKFRESDSRFMTYASKLFGTLNEFEWKNYSLTETFRCTKPMVDFINNCMIGHERLVSNKVSCVKPDYVICNSYNYPSTVITEYLRIYKPHEIFVVAFSTKDKTPIKHLANYVTNNLNVPIYCSGSDQESLDSRIIDNKLVFSTIHQIKGRERKAVIFIGFDDSYFEYYDKKANNDICPNELYVAVTRATERLTIIHDAKRNYLPFVKREELYKYTNFSQKQTNDKFKKIVQQSGDQSFIVSDLVGYLPFSVENACMRYIDVTIIQEPGVILNVQNVVKMDKEPNTGGTGGTGNGTTNGSMDDIFESVSDITGIAIPAHFEYTKYGSSSLFSKNLVEKSMHRIANGDYDDKVKIAMITKLKKFSKTLKDFHKKHIDKMDMNNLEISDLLKIALYYSAQQNKTDYKLKQINKFDWLTKSTMKEGMQRLSSVVKGTNLLFEESMESKLDKYQIIGEIDCIDNDNNVVYEFKCTKNLSSSHIIQLGIYIWMHMATTTEPFKYMLFNVFTGEIRELVSSYERLEEMIKMLVEHKLNGENTKSDVEFLEQNFKNLGLV